MDRLKKHWQSLLTAVLATLSLGMGSALAYDQLSAGDSCCQVGASCCYPGSPCCAAGHHEHTPRP